MSTLFFILNRALLAGGLNFIVLQSKNRRQDFVRMLAEQRRSLHIRRRV